MSSDDEMKDMVGGCCVCSDERGWDENPLVYCDGQGCNVAVHQACYGIVTVPTGPWFCQKCQSQERSARVKCELCPSRDGALKKADVGGGWAHVVCALYIPEVRFGNVTTMEPILISLIPTDRFGRTCYICETNNRGSKATAGACMQCNKQGCRQTFHVTCAQLQGLLCEEAGNMDNVKYCGYCQYHYGKLKTTKNMNVKIKIIPPFRPVPSSTSNNTNADSPGSSPEKEKPGSKQPSSTSDERLSSTTSSSSLSKNHGTGDYVPAKKTGSSNSISPDIDSSRNNSKTSKKSSHSSGGKSSDSSLSSKSNSNNAAVTPKIAQPILTPATFSTAPHSNSKILDAKEIEEKSVSDLGVEGNLQPSSKKLGKESDTTSKDDSFTVKLERVDNPLLKGASSQSKKDFSTLQLKEVVTGALDRPMSSSKYDHASSGLGGSATSGIESSAAGGSTSHSSSRHSHHGEKPAPPDIKPHVTLTPIPMRGSRISLTRGDSDDREEKEKEISSSTTKNKSPVGNSMQFSPFGPKMTNPAQSPSELLEVNSKLSKHSADASSPNEFPSDKSGPPSKRSRGASRDDERGRKTPTKGRGGGRRGSAHSGYKRDNFMDENSNEPMEVGNMSTSRGGRSGKKQPGGSRLMGRQAGDDPPAPTLSQLKAQMDAAAGGETASSGSINNNNSVGVLPTHMFGNALNPASSMAQRMVDTLSQEMEAVAAAGAVGIPDIVPPPAPVVGITLPGKSTIGSSIVNGTCGSTTSTLTNASGSAPQTLEQLLERQWEQGSQFLMEQAQHLDIAQLLSCLNQLKQDNRALEEHVGTLVQRRDQLIAINARLSIPLGNSSALGPLAPAFNNNVNGVSAQNGHGTPPPNLSAQGVTPHSSIPKCLQVNPSTPSPQQQQHAELMMQSTRHGHREERVYHSEMQVSRAEISVAHPTSSPHGHGHQQGRQNVAPYGYSGPTHSGGGGSTVGQPSHHSNQQSSHHSHRDHSTR